MKILHLIQKPQMRGAEIFACQLAHHLDGLGHECRVFVLFSGDAELPFAVDPTPIATHRHMKWFDLPGWWRLNRLVRTFRPDIIQANAADTLKYAVFSRLIFRWKSPVVFRNANLMSAFLNSWHKRILNTWTLKLADHIISVSRRCSEDLINSLGISRKTVTTVEIGIEMHHAPVRRSLEFVIPGGYAGSTEGPLLVSVAGFVPEKNHYGLIRIFKQIREDVPQAKLLLIGVGPLMEKIKDLVDDLGLTGSVIFMGRRTDVQEILEACQVLLMPSFIEGLPGVILEAMYARCAVVAHAVGGIPDVVTHCDTGLLIESGNEHRFAEAVISAIQDRDERIRMTERAYEMVCARFNNQVIAARFEEVYSRLVNSISPDVAR